MTLINLGVFILIVSLAYSITSLIYLSKMQELNLELFDEYEEKCRAVFSIGVIIVPIIATMMILTGLYGGITYGK